jgi:hypothetical protein
MSFYLRHTATILTNSRDSIDTQLGQIKDYLESTGLGYRGSLVDREGFLLPDIDHERILSQRQRAARLLNDRKRAEFICGLLTQTERSDGAPLFQDLERLRPFAFIDEVFANSPAEKAGLSNVDFVIRFGQATQIKHVPSQVPEDVPVVVTVFRVERSGRNVMDVTINPARWPGNGLIGAHLVPYPE